MISSFGPNTFLIPWSIEKAQEVMEAVSSGHQPLAGVRLTFVKAMDANEAAFSAWGESWIAASLPLDIFLEIERGHLRDKGALDLTHAVTGALYARMPD